MTKHISLCNQLQSAFVAPAFVPLSETMQQSHSRRWEQKSETHRSKSSARSLFALLRVSTSPNIGRHVPRYCNECWITSSAGPCGSQSREERRYRFFRQAD